MPRHAITAALLSLTLIVLAPVRSFASGPVQVRGHYRSNGTYVQPYTRGGPAAGNSGSSPRYFSSPLNRSSAPGAVTEEASPTPPAEIAKRPVGAFVDADGRFVDENGILRDPDGRIYRSGAAKGAFKRQQPCPSTGLTGGACPGYVVDHVVPLKNGGADDPSNMQWQTEAEAKEKDKWEGELVPGAAPQQPRVTRSWYRPPAPEPAPSTAPGPCGDTPPRTGADRLERATASFRSWTRCPSTGSTFGACPGYVIDYYTPPAKCGNDEPSNLQWVTERDAARNAAAR